MTLDLSNVQHTEIERMVRDHELSHEEAEAEMEARRLHAAQHPLLPVMSQAEMAARVAEEPGCSTRPFASRCASRKTARRATAACSS